MWVGGWIRVCDFWEEGGSPFHWVFPKSNPRALGKYVYLCLNKNRMDKKCDIIDDVILSDITSYVSLKKYVPQG